MNEHLTALSLHLATLTPSPSGWMTIDRDHAAAELGVSRVKLARLLSKAERPLGLIIDGDKVRMKTQSELILRENGLVHGWKERMLAVVESVLKSNYATGES